MNKLITGFATLTILLAVAACSSSSNNTTGMASSSATAGVLASQVDSAVMLDSTSSSIEADAHNIIGPNLLFGIMPEFIFPGMGLGLGFGFGLDKFMWSPAANCVAVNKVSDTAADMDIIYTFTCPEVTGTYEIKSTSDTTGNSFTVTDNLTFTRTDDRGNGPPPGAASPTPTASPSPTPTTTVASSNATDSTYSISKTSAGVLTIQKQYDDTNTYDSNTYERKGTSSYVFTPDSASNPWAGGGIVLTGSFDNVKNAVDQGTVTISSMNLHRSMCGFDSGSIQYQDATDTYVLTFTGCGNISLTDNGVAVNLNPGSNTPPPMATPAPSPTP